MNTYTTVYLCEHCVFQQSWQNASKKEREKLLELIRRLAEDDKEGIMANKVGDNIIFVIQTHCCSVD